MHWELSEEQEMFASSLREWLGAKFPVESVRAMWTSGDTEEFTAALVSAGWWGVGYAEESGGEGGGVLELALAAREFGRAAAPDSSWLSAVLAAPLLTKVDVAAQVSGDQRCAVVTRGDRVPGSTFLSTDGSRLTGVVPHVIGAAEATDLLVPVEGPGGRGIASVSAAEATVTAENLLDGGRCAARVEFADARVTAIKPEDGGLARVATRAAVLVAADALGSAERMLDLAVGYSKQRKQFGQLIGAFQAVKHAAAQMLVTVEAAYSTALYAAAAVDFEHDDVTTIAAVAKAQVTGRVAELADSALTVHGAIGYTWEHDLHLFYKRAKLNRALFGAPGVWNERIAAQLLTISAAED